MFHLWASVLALPGIGRGPWLTCGVSTPALLGATFFHTLRTGGEHCSEEAVFSTGQNGSKEQVVLFTFLCFPCFLFFFCGSPQGGLQIWALRAGRRAGRRWPDDTADQSDDRNNIFGIEEVVLQAGQQILKLHKIHESFMIQVFLSYCHVIVRNRFNELHPVASLINWVKECARRATTGSRLNQMDKPKRTAATSDSVTRTSDRNYKRRSCDPPWQHQPFLLSQKAKPIFLPLPVRQIVEIPFGNQAWIILKIKHLYIPPIGPFPSWSDGPMGGIYLMVDFQVDDFPIKCDFQNPCLFTKGYLFWMEVWARLFRRRSLDLDAMSAWSAISNRGLGVPKRQAEPG